MRFAVLSDIHGNHPALLKVLKDAKERGIDHFIIAGDYCLSGAWPNECIETLKEIPNKQIIRGNEERYLENLIGKDQSKWTDGQMQISYWNYRNIQTKNLDYILSLPQNVDFECNGMKIHVAHASDAFIGEYEFGQFGPGVLAKKYEKMNVTPDILQKDIAEILDNDPVFAEKVNALEEGIYIFGHSHVQWSYKAKDKNLLLINPGSCGLPLDAIEGSIPYSILTIPEDFNTQLSNSQAQSGGDYAITLEQIRLPFSKEDYVEQLKLTTQYTEASVWSKVITYELLTAREHLTFFLQFADRYANDHGDHERPFSVKTWEEAYKAWETEIL